MRLSHSRYKIILRVSYEIGCMNPMIYLHMMKLSPKKIHSRRLTLPRQKKTMLSMIWIKKEM